MVTFMCGVYDATPRLLNSNTVYQNARIETFGSWSCSFYIFRTSVNSVSFKSPVEDGVSMMDFRDFDVNMWQISEDKAGLKF